MSECTPHYAPIVALLLLGTLFAVGASLLALPAGARTMAQGQGYFVVVNVNTWFDEKTVSPHRGNSPLTPGERAITLIDDSGHRYGRTVAGETALASADGPPLLLVNRFGPAIRTQLEWFSRFQGILSHGVC